MQYFSRFIIIASHYRQRKDYFHKRLLNPSSVTSQRKASAQGVQNGCTRLLIRWLVSNIAPTMTFYILHQYGLTELIVLQNSTFLCKILGQLEYIRMCGASQSELVFSLRKFTLQASKLTTRFFDSTSFFPFKISYTSNLKQLQNVYRYFSNIIFQIDIPFFPKNVFRNILINLKVKRVDQLN